MDTINVLLVHPDLVRRLELVAFLSAESDLQVIGGGETLVDACRANSEAREVHVLVIKIIGDEAGSTGDCLLFHALLPGVPLVAIAEQTDTRAIKTAIGAGAVALQPEDIRASVLCNAVRQGAQWNPCYDETLARRLRVALSGIEEEAGRPGAPVQSIDVRGKLQRGKGVCRLSSREEEMLYLIARGLRNKEIAARLYVSEKTVRNTVTSILAKLGLRSRTEAALWAVAAWVAPSLESSAAASHTHVKTGPGTFVPCFVSPGVNTSYWRQDRSLSNPPNSSR